MFQLNDMILYGTNGVCKLAAIEDRDCGGKMVTYYVLKPIYSSSSTVFVPVNNEKLTSKMRPVLTKEQIDDMLHGIPEEYAGWIDDERLRKEKFKELVGRADTFELIQLIKTLLKHKEDVLARGKKMHMADERMLQEAEKIICDEFSYVLGIAADEVPEYIQSKVKAVGSEICKA